MTQMGKYIPFYFHKTSFCFFIVLILLILYPYNVWAGKDTWTSKLPTTLSTDTIRSLAIHPTDSLRILGGDDTSLVYLTSNGGISWTSVKVDPLRNYRIVGLIFDPQGPDTAIFAATSGGGVYFSSNGLLWSKRNSGMIDSTLSAIEIDPLNTQQIYVGSSKGVFKTNNRGYSWFTVNAGLSLDSLNITTITLDRSNPNILYAGTSTGVIYQTIDGGGSWSRRNAVALPSSITDLVVNTKHPNVIYVSTVSNGIYISTAQGTSPATINTGLTDLRVLSLAIDTSRSVKIYAGTNGNGAFMLREGNTTWQSINSGLTNGVIYSLAVNPRKSHEIFAGTRGLGIFSYLGNRAPILNRIGNKYVNINSTLSFTVVAQDPDSAETQDLAYGVIGIPVHATYDSFATHIFQWTPDSSQVGLDTLIFTVLDRRGGSDRDTVVIRVNRNPVFTSISAQTVNENSLLDFSVSATDADGDSITYSVSTLLPNGQTSILPSGATFDTSGLRRFLWTPPYSTVTRSNVTALYTVTFTARDSRGGSRTLVVPITVRDANRPPTIEGLQDSYYINQGSALEIEVKGEDLDLDPLKYGVINILPTGASFDSLRTHKFSWIPTFSDSGTKQVIFEVRDDRGGIGRDTTYIQVQFTNQYPVIGALADTYFVNVNDSLKFRITATDGDRDSLTYSASGLPDGALFTQATTQDFKWIPNFYQGGTYQVTFNVNDGRGGVAYKKVYIIVNQPPKFQTIENKVINEGDTLRLIAKAQDLDRDSLTLTVSNLPTGATITNFRDSVRVIWNTNYSSSGVYTIVFIAADKKRGKDTLRVQITVNNVNRKPVFVSILQQSVNVGNILQFTVTANDSDQNPLQYSALRLPIGATFDSVARQFRWVPILSQVGRDTARFQVSDNYGGKDTLRVPLLVVNQNFAPVITPTGTKRIAEGSELIFTVVASDANGDTLKYSISGIPQGAQFDTTIHPAPLFRWRPSYTQAGLYVVIFITNDGKGGVTRDTVRITVTNLNQAPLLNFSSDTTVSEGTSLRLNLRASDTDNDPIQVTVSPAAPDGSIIQKIGIDFIFSWTPTYRQAGNYFLTFTARDTSDSSASKVLRLKVLNVNRPPSRPTIIYPKKGEVLTSENYLIWQRSYDPDTDDSLYYRIEFDNDSTFRSPDLTVQQLVIDTTALSKSAQPPGSQSLNKADALFKQMRTALSTNGIEAVAVKINQLEGFSLLSDNVTYYWRVRGQDNHDSISTYSPGIDYFIFNKGSSIPRFVTSGFTPRSGDVIKTLTPTITWNPATDPDPDDNPATLKYKVEINDSNFAGSSKYKYISRQGETSVKVTTSLDEDKEWFYRIQTVDAAGTTSYYSEVQNFYTNSVDEPPRPFSLVNPLNNVDINPVPSQLEFNWRSTTDPDPKDSLTFSLEISKDSLFQNQSLVIATNNIPGNVISAGLPSLLLPRTKYFWRVLARDRSGLVTISQQVWSFILGEVTGIEEEQMPEGFPTEFTLLQNYPNPFNGETIIRFGLPHTAEVRIGIYNLLGQLVAELSTGRFSAGWHVVRWDGKNKYGQPCSSGMYLCRFFGYNFTFSKKIVYMK